MNAVGSAAGIRTSFRSNAHAVVKIGKPAIADDDAGFDWGNVENQTPNHWMQYSSSSSDLPSAVSTSSRGPAWSSGAEARAYPPSRANAAQAMLASATLMAVSVDFVHGPGGWSPISDIADIRASGSSDALALDSREERGAGIDLSAMLCHLVPMDLPKCRTCNERHRLGLCPSLQTKSRIDRVKPVAELTVVLGGGSSPQGRKSNQVGPIAGARPFKKPLAKDAHKTLMATKPWEADGLSRRTWYRRQAEKRENEKW